MRESSKRGATQKNSDLEQQVGNNNKERKNQFINYKLKLQTFYFFFTMYYLVFQFLP
jgi:hypothetical protein